MESRAVAQQACPADRLFAALDARHVSGCLRVQEVATLPCHSDSSTGQFSQGLRRSPPVKRTSYLPLAVSKASISLRVCRAAIRTSCKKNNNPTISNTMAKINNPAISDDKLGST